MSLPVRTGWTWRTFPGKSRLLALRDQGTDWGVGGLCGSVAVGEVIMWGIRAIRVWFLFVGLVATIAASGCGECCKNLWKSEKSVPTTTGGFESKQVGATNTTNDKDPEKVLSDWKRGAESYPGYPNEPKGHLTPERIQGGIY